MFLYKSQQSPNEIMKPPCLIHNFFPEELRSAAVFYGFVWQNFSYG